MITAPALLKQLDQGAFQPVPLLLVFGEEPLYLRRVQDAWRAQMRSLGYLQRERFEMDANNACWQELQMETQAGSLFSEQRLIELDLPKGSPGKEGGAFLQQWFAQAPIDPQTGQPEICLLLRCEKLDWRQQKAKWFQTIEQKGLVVQSKPIEGQALTRWCGDRARESGLEMDPEAAAMLAERVEGNLLAADQEVEKLALFFEAGHRLTVADIESKVADQAHYQLFALSTAALKGQVAHALQILHRLQQEGLEAPIVLWLLAKEVRQLSALSQLQTRMSLGQAFKQLKIWQSRQAEFNAALSRHSDQTWQTLTQQALAIDLSIKGQSASDPWLGLSQLVTQLAGSQNTHRKLDHRG
ncbi:MAG: DNA polymerase III subunit delta [Hydrogenovibrio sp.]|uniref:DNA polymerase III subunit delta n=1 Tax=Hydrogenovibrio sp. TaxID=2065821 RepID=UPI0028701941|nr:DNA polymerase III subunit delta [Hydrogenovibrio sp.]MDR9499646.1 DNA polymerase III subunit delta [Hydrogenovibrio sp.]